MAAQPRQLGGEGLGELVEGVPPHDLVVLLVRRQHRAAARVVRHRRVQLGVLVPDLNHHSVGPLAGDWVPCLHAGDELVVRKLLVQDSLALVVDADHRVPGPQDGDLHGRVAAQRLHEVDRPAPGLLHVAQLSTDRARDSDEVAGVGQRRTTTGAGVAQEVVDQLLVVGEPAGGEHGAHPRADPQRRAVDSGGHDTGHSFVVHDDALHAVAHPNVDPGFVDRGGQGVHRNGPTVGAGLIHAFGKQGPAGGDAVLGKVRPVLAVHPLVLEAQRTAVMQQLDGLGGAAVDRAQELELPSGLPEGGALRVVPLRPGGPCGEAQEVLLRVLDSGLAQPPVVRRPAGERGLPACPAKFGCLLQQHDVQPAPGAEKGSCLTTRPAADDHDVDRGVDVWTALRASGLAGGHRLVPGRAHGDELFHHVTFEGVGDARQGRRGG